MSLSRVWAFLILRRFVTSSLAIASEKAEVCNDGHVQQRDGTEGRWVGWSAELSVQPESKAEALTLPEVLERTGVQRRGGRVVPPQVTPWLRSTALTQAVGFDVGEPSSRSGHRA